MRLDDIFSDLGKFGLAKVVEKQEAVFKEPVKKQETKKEKETVFNIKDYVYGKKFTCPACHSEVISTVVKEKKIRIDSVEFDLHLKCAPIDPIFYDIIICSSCGYTATKNSFKYLPERQAKLILENISPNFKFVDYPEELTIDMAIDRYKLALLNCMVKQGKSGEKAYLCMKICWLYRVKGDKENLKRFAKLAIMGYNDALAQESLPIMGLTDNTIIYIIAAFSKVLKDYDSALKALSEVILSKTASERLKGRARDLKTELIVLKTQKDISQEEKEDAS